MYQVWMYLPKSYRRSPVRDHGPRFSPGPSCVVLRMSTGISFLGIINISIEIRHKNHKASRTLLRPAWNSKQPHRWTCTLARINTHFMVETYPKIWCRRTLRRKFCWNPHWKSPVKKPGVRRLLLAALTPIQPRSTLSRHPI